LILPDNYTETEVIDIINTVADRLCYKFKFGYHSAEDMKQQARLYAWEGMEKYDGKRPLENFLWTHVRNRLYNFKRNNYSRLEKPCDTCEFFKNKRCMAFDDQM
jgi:DNA-directed RNA polymerase specialized sigma24 family protein